MAVNSVMVARMARLLALAHIAVGALLICFGIADQVVDAWTDNYYFGIWIGVWMCITGSLGIPGSGRDITRSRNVFAGVFMGFSITSAVMGGIMIINYGASIASIRDYYSEGNYIIYHDIRNYDAKMAICIIILLLGIAEFGMGIWAAVCCCLISPCCACCAGAPEHQFGMGIWAAVCCCLMSPCCACCAGAPEHQLYTDNTTGYVTTLGVGGVPVATPVQVGGGMVPVSHAQTAQPLMVLVPASGEVGGHPAMVQASGTTAMPATVSFQEPMKQPPHV